VYRLKKNINLWFKYLLLYHISGWKFNILETERRNKKHLEKSILVINHVILNMFRRLLLAPGMDVLFKRMYLKKMTALFNSTFLKQEIFQVFQAMWISTFQ